MKSRRIDQIQSKAAALCSSLLILWVTQPAGAAEDSLSRPKATYLGISSKHLGSVEKASKLLGGSVRNLQDEKLGKIEDMAIDVEAGQIVEVIIATGGILPKKLIAVPPAALAYDSDHKVTRLNVDQERLKAAPEFDSAKWSEYCQSNRVVEVYHYYGCEPYFVTYQRLESPKAAAERSEAQGSLAIPLGYVDQGSKFIGLPVRNKQGEKLGKVDDLAVDLEAGRIVAVVISSGGFLGIGDELSAVPPQAFSYNSQHDVLWLDVSKETLSQAPHFKSTAWPDLASPRYVATVYRAYGIEPYFEANQLEVKKDVSK